MGLSRQLRAAKKVYMFTTVIKKELGFDRTTSLGEHCNNTVDKRDRREAASFHDVETRWM